jgi:hypothetical protein
LAGFMDPATASISHRLLEDFDIKRGGFQEKFVRAGYRLRPSRLTLPLDDVEARVLSGRYVKLKFTSAGQF